MPGMVAQDRRHGPRDDRLGRFLSATGLILSAIVGLAVAGCSQAGDRQARQDAANAAGQAGVALNAAAADTKATVNDLAAEAKPSVQRAASDAKTGLDTLAVAAGRATVKAGASLEHAGERSKLRDGAADANQGD